MTRRHPAHAERIAELLHGFKLTTAAEELVPRLVAAGHEPALATIAEVFGLEEDARHERRVARLRRAPKLSAGKTFETLDDKRQSPPRDPAPQRCATSRATSEREKLR